MLLKALVDLAKHEGLLDDPAFDTVTVDFLIRIDNNGHFIALESLLEPVNKKLRGRPMRVPGQPKRTSAVTPYLLADKAEYVLGFDPAGKKDAKKLANYQKAFRERCQSLASETQSSRVVAVVRFLERPEQVQQAVDALRASEAKAMGQLTFVCEPDTSPVVAADAVKKWIRDNQSAESSEDYGTCLVTGAAAAKPETTKGIKFVPSGQASGCALVTFNANAFESYGFKAFANAPLSTEANLGYALGLNRLLHPAYPDPKDPANKKLPRRNFSVSADTTLVYWSDGDDSLLDGLAAYLDNHDPEAVQELLGSLYSGRLARDVDTTRFYAALIAGNAARVVVRDFAVTTLQALQSNLCRYFDDIAIVRNGDEPLSLFQLMIATAAFRKKENVHPNLGRLLVRSALFGDAPGLLVVQAVLARLRAGDDCRDAHAALIKLYFARREPSSDAPGGAWEASVALDESDGDIAYRLGRAFAVLEKLQVDAVGPNQTIRDRFFASASATPGSVMPRLLRGAQPHVAGARGGQYLDKLLQDVLDGVDRFPSTLDLEGQGRFALGYYHQRKSLYTKRNPESGGANEETAA